MSFAVSVFREAELSGPLLAENVTKRTPAAIYRGNLTPAKAATLDVVSATLERSYSIGSTAMVGSVGDLRSGS